MTEDQARKTICPKMSAPLINMNGDQFLYIVNCSASDCGCWKWEEHLGRAVMTKDGKQGHCGLIR